MKLITKPGTFFNQLQWSSYHWFILVAFMVVAMVETQLGRDHHLYTALAQVAGNWLGTSADLGLWVVMFVRLATLLVGSFVLGVLVWFVGGLFGRHTSKRVLFRRLAVVFTVFLAGYLVHHLSKLNPNLAFVALGFYLWGMLLGYFAIREQFALNHLETIVIGLFLMIMVTSTWHFSHQALERVVAKDVAAHKMPRARAR